MNQPPYSIAECIDRFGPLQGGTTNRPWLEDDGGWMGQVYKNTVNIVTTAATAAVLLTSALANNISNIGEEQVPTFGVINHVQSTAANNDATATSIAAAAQNHQSGDSIIVQVRWSSATATCSVSDTAGNVYTSVKRDVLNSGDVHTIEQFEAHNAIGAANNVVTATFSASVTYRGIVVSEFNGISKANPVDATASGQITTQGTSVTSNAFTTVQSDELLICGFTPDGLGEVYTPGSGYVIPFRGSSDYIGVQYKTVSTIQSGVTATINWSAAARGSILVGTYKAGGLPDEDFWQNLVAPIPPTLYQKLPYLPDPEELVVAIPATLQPDDDLWGNPVAPLQGSNYQNLPHEPDPDVIPGNLFGEYDEDFWSLGPRPVPGSVYETLPILPDAEELPSGSLFGQPDEDLWTNAVAPVATIEYQPLPYLPDGQDIPAGTLYGPADESLWLPSPQVQITPCPTQFPDDDILPVAATGFGLDEDFWTAPVPCGFSAYISVYLPDAENLLVPAAPSIAAEDDAWQSQATTSISATHILFYDAEDASTLSGQPDEDYWVNLIGPVQYVFQWLQQWTLDVQETAVFLAVASDDAFDLASLTGVYRQSTGQSSLPIFGDIDFAPTAVLDDVTWNAFGRFWERTIGDLYLPERESGTIGVYISPVGSIVKGHPIRQIAGDAARQVIGRAAEAVRGK